MGKLIEIESGRTTILVESADIGYEGGLVQAGGVDLEKNLIK